MVNQWVTLSDKKLIKEVFQKGIRVGSKALSICFKKNSLTQTRYLFCSDRTTKTAVYRNKVKRILRALVREKDLVHPSGYDIAILGGKEFVNKDFSERKKILFTLLKNVTIK